MFPGDNNVNLHALQEIFRDIRDISVIWKPFLSPKNTIMYVILTFFSGLWDKKWQLLQLCDETCFHKVRVSRFLRGAAVFSVSNELVIFYFPLMYIWTLYVCLFMLSFYFFKNTVLQ